VRVGFFTVFRRDPQHYVLAETLIRSVRANMPDVPIVQFTDETSPEVLGVDEVWRRAGGPMLEVRLQHYAACEGEWLLVDTDVLIRRDVSAVFDDKTFDVALARRDWPHLAAESERLTAAGMPYNTGVVFSRSRAFWQEVLSEWRRLPEKERDWLSEQRTVARILHEIPFGLKELPGTYNYPPEADVEPPREVMILHYKGGRKDIMLPQAKGYLSGVPVVPPPFRTEVQQNVVIEAGAVYPAVGAVPFQVFLGYDPRQPVAYHVAAHSIQRRASVPVAITRLQLDQLPITRRGLTEFTYSRFLVPWLCGFQGRALFADADVLCRADVAELLALAPADKAVSVVQNARRFEWASLMVFNNPLCTPLTPEYVEDPSHGLFDLAWAGGVGALPSAWNHLEGYDDPRPDAKLVHFTQGVPVWPETRDTPHAAEWLAEREAAFGTVSFAELMGASVHVSHVKQRLAKAPA
jgi:glycosyl transferase family 8